jgi:hypothetical protein
VRRLGSASRIWKIEKIYSKLSSSLKEGLIPLSSGVWVGRG